jgi:hypothetical protein
MAPPGDAGPYGMRDRTQAPPMPGGCRSSRGRMAAGDLAPARGAQALNALDGLAQARCRAV